MLEMAAVDNEVLPEQDGMAACQSVQVLWSERGKMAVRTCPLLSRNTYVVVMEV